MTGAVSSSAALRVPNENLYGVTLAADLHGVEETTGQLNVNGQQCTHIKRKKTHRKIIIIQGGVVLKKHHTKQEQRSDIRQCQLL